MPISLEDLEQSLRRKRDLGKLMGVHAPSQAAGPDRLVMVMFASLKKQYWSIKSRERSWLLFFADGTADHEYRAQDHFESCVQSLHRAMEYLEHLRRFGYKRGDGTPFIPKPRELEVLRDSIRDQVRDMRDAVEHLDRDILEGRLGETVKVGIHLGWERASLGGWTLGYADVARWITQLHEYAALLSRVHLVVGPAPPQGDANDA